MMSLPFSILLSKDTSRVTTKDPVTPSLKSCVSHSDRDLPGGASSVDVSVFTIICRPGLFGCASPPGIWNSYFKFCVDRNPWDKVLSHYHMHAYRLGGALSLDQYFAR